MYRLMPFLCLCSLGSALAASEIDCSTVEVPALSGLRYYVKSADGRPSNTVLKNMTFKDLFAEPFDFNDCGYHISGDKNKVVMSADNLTDVLKLINGISPTSELKKFVYLNILGSSGYRTPGVESSFYLNYYSVLIDADYNELSVIDKSHGALPDAIIGFNFDGGLIKGLLYEGETYKTEIPSGTRTLDVYASPSHEADTYFGRFQLDFTKNRITVWRRYDFPSN